MLDNSELIKSHNMPNLPRQVIDAGSARAEKPVLVISRDDDSRLLLKTLLELWNYRTVEVKDAAEAIHISRNNCPNLILMESNFSFSTTLENLYRIRRDEKLNKVVIVLISSHPKAIFKEISIANGADYFFSKPLNFTRLEKFMKKFMLEQNAKFEESI